MKIITEEEKKAHKQYVLMENIKGCAVGAIAGLGLIQYVKRRYPAKFNTFSTSIKAAMFAMPTIAIGAFFADDGSVKFDHDKYQGDYQIKIQQEKQEFYNNLSQQEKIMHQLNENKYGIIVSAWAASLYGSWRLVDRDAYMSKSQKIVQARVYAQAITVVLLLSTILLSMQEAKIKAKQPPAMPEWKRYLAEQEEIKKHESLNKSV